MSVVIFTNNNNSFDEFINAKTNNPVLRKNKISESIQNKINTKCIVVNDEIDIKWLELVHDAEYIHFPKNCYDSFAKSSDISWKNSDGGLLPCNFYKELPHLSVPLYKLSGFYGSDTMTRRVANEHVACRHRFMKIHGTMR